MEYAQINTQYYCGVDLHARSMYTTVMDKAGNILFHRNMQNNFDIFKGFIHPFLPDLCVGVETSAYYYWLADACQEAGIPFYLGHALYMKAISGKKKKNDRIDSKTITDLMRANLFPLAYAYPREMRATRDLLRRRHRYVGLRAEAYGHIQLIFNQQGVYEVVLKDVKNKYSRRTLIQKLKHPDLQMTIEANLDMMEAFDPIINKLERQIRARAKYHNRRDFNILQTVPGIGDILTLTILYEIHTIKRFPSVQRFSSYGRLVKCERESVGKKTGGGNQKIGNPYLKWAFGEIIIVAQRTSPLIKKQYQKLQAKYGLAGAKSIMTHKFGVAVYYMLKNGEAFDEKRFVQSGYK